MRLRSFLLLGLPLTLVAAAPFGYSLTSSTTQKAPPKIADKRKAGERLCASRAVNERLKSRIFDDAAAAGDGPSSNLDLLASFSEVRMDQPLLKSQDEELGVTVCTGRFVLLLPPGSEQKFGGRTLLQADVEYAAQPAADGSGLVYQLRGADSIAYRLAAYNLRPDQALAARAEAEPDVPMLAEPLPTLAAAPPAPPIESIIEAPAPVAKIEVKVPEPAELAKVEKKAAKAATPERQPVKLAAVGTKPKAEKAKSAVSDRKPVKLAKAEPKKPEPQKAAKAPKADRKEVRTAAKSEKETKAAKQKRVELAEAKKATAKAEKRRVALAAAEKAEKVEKARKLATAAATKRETERKLAKANAAKAKLKVQLAAATKKAPAAKPSPSFVAKAPPKPRPEASGTTNSFLVYEQRKATTRPATTAEVEPAVRPTAARDSCAAAADAEARLVCANPNLRAKQRSVANTYYAALEDADSQTRRMLTGSRSRFAAYLNRCSTASCLAGAYDDRLAEIRDIMDHY